MVASYAPSLQSLFVEAEFLRDAPNCLPSRGLVQPLSTRGRKYENKWRLHFYNSFTKILIQLLASLDLAGFRIQD